MGKDDKPVPFDPNTIMDGVKDKIKAEFINLIPEDAWKAMVKTEVDRYFKTAIDRNYSNHNQYYTPFATLVHNELQDHCKAKFKEFLGTPEFNSNEWKDGQQVMSEAVKKFIVENSGEVMANFFGNMMQSALMSIRTQM